MELVVGFLGLGGGEIILVVLLILVLFGADRIPDLARSLGRAQARFSAARNEVVETLEIERAGMTREQVMMERAREAQMRAQASAGDNSEAAAPSGDEERARAPSGDKPDS